MSSLSVSLAFIFMNSSHPLVFIAIILAQATLLCVTLWISISLRWFSYILFLIFLGGLIVLFVYTVSLASNEIIFITSRTFIIPLATFVTLLTLAFSINEESITLAPDLVTNKFFLIYAIKGGVAILFTIFYLLFTLIVVVKIADKYDAPIKRLIFLH